MHNKYNVFLNIFNTNFINFFHLRAYNRLYCLYIDLYFVSLVAQMVQIVKNMSTMQESQFRSLGWEDPLEKEMATHFSIFAWRIPLTEKLGGLESMGLQRIGHD